MGVCDSYIHTIHIVCIVIVADEDKMEEQRSNVDPSQHLIEEEEHSEATPPPQLDDITSCQQTNVTSSGARKEKTGPPMIDPTAYLTPRDKVGGALGVASQQLLKVHEAFAGDDVVGEFEREREEEEAGRENFQLDVLPGQSPHTPFLWTLE